MKRIVAIIAVVLVCVQAGFAGSISVAGSTTVQPIVSAASVVFQKEHTDTKITIGGGGSSQGVQLAGEGKVMLGMASRDMKDEEKTKYADLKPVKIGLDGIAIILNEANPVKELTKQQVVDIYTGKITNWKDVGGKDAPIELVAMGSTHGTHELFLEYFGLESKETGKTQVHGKKGEKAGTVEAKAVESGKDAIAAVIMKPNAVGYVSVGAVEKVIAKGGKVKSVVLDGVQATKENVANGKYPLKRNLWVLTKGEPSGDVKAFIDFLVGPQGQAIVTELDFVSVK